MSKVDTAISFEELHRVLDPLKTRDPANLSMRLNHHVVMQNIIKEVNPKSILEIGFLVGHSALMWLYFSDANVVSIDRTVDDGALKARSILEHAFENRFTLVKHDLYELDHLVDLLKIKNYDLMFMDAGLEEECELSIKLANKLKIPYLLFDCWLHKRFVSLLNRLKSEDKIEHVINYRCQSSTFKLYRNKDI